MKRKPRNRIAKEAIKSWRLTAIGFAIVAWVGAVAALYLFHHLEWPVTVSIILLLVGILGTYLIVFRLPSLMWRRWRYEVFEKEIFIQHGLLVVTQTLIPMVRIQHVDTKQGPILKKYHLSSVTISTAATTHIIPALLEDDAVELRDRISALARVNEDDV